jgi:HtrA serine peptidase 2
VIGISNLKAIAGDGVSFAIPIDTAKGIISQLLQPSGRVARPYIGCKTLELSSRCGSWLQRMQRLIVPAADKCWRLYGCSPSASQVQQSCHFLLPSCVRSLAAELRAGSSSFPDVAAGIYVPYVQPGGPADRAGLVSGDVITGARWEA